MGRMDSFSWKTKSTQIISTEGMGRICKTTVAPSLLQHPLPNRKNHLSDNTTYRELA